MALFLFPALSLGLISFYAWSFLIEWEALFMKKWRDSDLHTERIVADRSNSGRHWADGKLNVYLFRGFYHRNLSYLVDLEYHFFLLKKIFCWLILEKEKFICSPYWCLHWLILVWALTRDHTHNAGILRWHPNLLWCSARALNTISFTLSAGGLLKFLLHISVF